MIYLQNITTPANTPTTSPLKTVVKITKGLVFKLELSFPPGPSGLLHVYIKHGGHKVWPSGSLDAFCGDNNTISFDDVFLVQQPPYSFDIYTYNNDDTYEHSVNVRIGLVSQEIFMARFLPTYTYDHFLKMLKGLEEEEKAEREKQEQLIIKDPLPWIAPEVEV